ncbi:MAG: hypothetical protein HY077_15310 [Elusimicrobia bacterium]|nr:hypothetical protein [Elusimicrobiota bacterium]
MPASSRYKALARLSNNELEKIFRASKGPTPESLAGWEWRGYNTPWFCSVIGIRQFIKGFFRNERGGIEGYNIPPKQTGLDGEWVQKPSPEAPKRFGFYVVGPVRADSVDNLYPDALLLDYGASPRNASWRVERLLRDYVVQPDEKNQDIMLGKAYLALGRRVPTSFFVIERLRKTNWKP